MNSNEFIACIGKAEESPEVQEMLAAVGVTKKLKMPKDDIEARADLPKQGLSLIFEPEGHKSSRLIFTGVQFFSDAEQGFITYPGVLPGNVLFTDSQVEVHAKLGKPLEVNKAMRIDGWKFDGLLLTVEYTKKDHRIAMIAVEIPPKP